MLALNARFAEIRGAPLQRLRRRRTPARFRGRSRPHRFRPRQELCHARGRRPEGSQRGAGVFSTADSGAVLVSLVVLGSPRRPCHRVSMADGTPPGLPHLAGRRLAARERTHARELLGFLREVFRLPLSGSSVFSIGNPLCSRCAGGFPLLRAQPRTRIFDVLAAPRQERSVRTGRAWRPRNREGCRTLLGLRCLFFLLQSDDARRKVKLDRRNLIE